MKKGLIIIIAIMIGTCLKAQVVTTVETETEEMDSVKFSRLVKSYEKIIMAEREELTLIKADIFGPFLFVLSGIDSSKHNVIRLSFERKFKPEWSWLVAFDAQANENDFTEFRYRGGVRYYFDINKRILRGKSANNFSANYFSGRVSYRRRPLINDNQFSIDLLVGVQRRLWKFGYLDVDLGIENIIHPFENKSFGIGLTSSIQIGIAF